MSLYAQATRMQQQAETRQKELLTKLQAVQESHCKEQAFLTSQASELVAQVTQHSFPA